jgi:hypothetical protein
MLHVLAPLPDPVADDEPWRRLLASRGRRRRVRSHPGVVAHIESDCRVVPGGGGAAPHSSHDALTAAGDPVLYVREDDADALMAAYRLRDDWDGNVSLVVVPAAIPGIPRQCGHALAAVAAADLLDEDDPRARHAGRMILSDCRAALAERGWIPGGIS